MGLALQIVLQISKQVGGLALQIVAQISKQVGGAGQDE